MEREHEGPRVRPGDIAPAQLDPWYGELFDAVALPVLALDSETWRIVAANQAALDQYGYARGEFVGMSVLEVRPPEGRDQAREVLEAIPQGLWRTRGVAHCRKDGSVFWADVWSRDAIIDGGLVRICTISDVTDRVELERKLHDPDRPG